MNGPAPIVVFAYKRPQTLRRMLHSLAANELADRSRLIIRCDGAKAGASSAEIEGVRAVRELARAVSGFASVEVHEATANKGLARSVIEGVTDAVERFGRTIVVEDDVRLSPHFLRFMNDALDRFAAVEQVFSVGSWNYFADPRSLPGNFFLRYPDSIAWATWKRSWDLFELDGTVLMEALRQRDLLDRLDGDGRVRYLSTMLKAQVNGEVDSWAVRWTANSILQEKLNYFPRTSLSLHEGVGPDATHEQGTVDYNKGLELAVAPQPVVEAPLRESEIAFDQWASYVKEVFEGGSDTSLKARVWRALPKGLKHWYLRNKSATEATPSDLEFEPVSRVFGFDRGKPVDRYYIERFLAKQRHLIEGHVLEIEEPLYTRLFGSSTVRSEVLRFTGEPGPAIRIGDLTKHATLPSNELDTFICTQTLNFIYDFQQAVRGLHHSLKPGGHALVTLAGIVQISRYDADQWGDFWRFTPQSAKRMFEEVFGKGQVTVEPFGNSYAASCLMKGFATEECDEGLLDRIDGDYPVVITVVARKQP